MVVFFVGEKSHTSPYIEWEIHTVRQQAVNLVLDTIKAAKEKKKSLQSCNSTVTKAFNIHRKHILS